MLAAALGSVIVAIGVSSGAAWAQGEGVQTTLSHDDEPVAGVTISVYTEGDDLVGSAETDAEGYWTVPVPEPAVYRVELDETTLPDGLVATTGNVREPEVRPGDVGNVLFPIGTAAERQPDPAAGQDDEQPQPTPGIEIPDDPQQEPEIATGPGKWDRVVSLGYSGIHYGLIIALAALGLSLVFGTMGLINFSHGELVTFGAFAAVVVNVTGIAVFGMDLRLHLLIATPVAVALGMLFGYLQDRFFWGWLRRRGTGLIAMMIISIGAALLLRHLYLYFMGPGRQPYAEYTIQQPLEIGPLNVMPKTLITDAIALVVLVTVALALVLTRLGKAIRAVADNPALAAASGINVDRIIRVVWSAGGGLAALSGVFLAMHETTQYLMGFQMLLLIFAAVIVGGLGTAFGAVVGGLIVGVLVQVSTLWLPSEVKYVVALTLLIAVLLVRPQGLLGRRARIG